MGLSAVESALPPSREVLARLALIHKFLFSCCSSHTPPLRTISHPSLNAPSVLGRHVRVKHQESLRQKKKLVYRLHIMYSAETEPSGGVFNQDVSGRFSLETLCNQQASVLWSICSAAWFVCKLVGGLHNFEANRQHIGK